MKKLLLIACIATMSSCTILRPYTSRTATYWVNSYQVGCTGVTPMTCLQVQETEDLDYNNWKNFYNHIDSFEFEYGYLQKIKVHETFLNPDSIPADAPSVQYKLIEVLERKFDDRVKLNYNWKLTDFYADSEAKFDKTPNLKFSLEEGKVSGTNGCNNFVGQIDSVTTTAIGLSRIASTLMACPNMTDSRKFSKALESATSYELKAGTLLLKDAMNEPLMRLEKSY